MGPGILHASHESRAQAIKHLKPVFSMFRNSKPFYFNLDIDQLHFAKWEVMTWFNKSKYLYIVARDQMREMLTDRLKLVVIGGQIWRNEAL
jgi:hypothetical protein